MSVFARPPEIALYVCGGMQCKIQADLNLNMYVYVYIQLTSFAYRTVLGWVEYGGYISSSTETEPDQTRRIWFFITQFYIKALNRFPVTLTAFISFAVSFFSPTIDVKNLHIWI